MEPLPGSTPVMGVVRLMLGDLGCPTPLLAMGGPASPVPTRLWERCMKATSIRGGPAVLMSMCYDAHCRGPGDSGSPPTPALTGVFSCPRHAGGSLESEPYQIRPGCSSPHQRMPSPRPTAGRGQGDGMLPPGAIRQPLDATPGPRAELPAPVVASTRRLPLRNQHRRNPVL